MKVQLIKHIMKKTDMLVNNLSLDDQSIQPTKIDNVVKNLILKYLKKPDETIKKITEKYDLTEQNLKIYPHHWKILKIVLLMLI